MFIESVVVCDRYNDFLAETLPHNRLLFDKMVVVTSYEDKATQRLCEYWNVECVPTDRLQSRKGQFCKGAGINDGLARLSLKGWAVHMDADIMLPPLTRQILDRANLDPSFVYGVDRHMVPSYGDWRKFLSTPGLQQEAKVFCHTRHFEIGVRVIPDCFDGYVPIGFFQLWHPETSGVRTYPEQHTNAARGDVLFAIQWPRAKRSLIPEIICYHLESEKAPMGANWNGRATKRFSQNAAPEENYEFEW